MPGPPLEVLALAQPQEGGHHVGDVEPDHRDGRDRGVGGAVPQVRQAEYERAAGGEPDRVSRRPGPLVHPVPQGGAGQRAVPGESIDHPRVRGDRRHAAEQLGADHDEHYHLGGGRAQGVDEDLDGRFTGGRGHRGGVVLDAEGKPDQQDPAGEQGDDDGHHDSARAAARRRVRFLGHVRRCVVAGEGVLGHQQADREHVEGAVPAGEVDDRGEHEVGRLVVRRVEGEEADDEQYADDVPPDAHVVQQRDQPDAELVQQAVHKQHARVDDDGDPVVGRRAEHQVQPRVDEERRAEVNARGDRDLAEEVEPPGEPRPRRGVVLGQLGGPVVQAAGGGVAGAHFGHGQADHQGHHADERPAPDDGDRAADDHPVAVQRQAAGEDRNDGERDGEVGESRHAPAQLLGVAHLVEALLVLGHRRAVIDGHGSSSLVTRRARRGVVLPGGTPGRLTWPLCPNGLVSDH